MKQVHGPIIRTDAQLKALLREGAPTRSCLRAIDRDNVEILGRYDFTPHAWAVACEVKGNSQSWNLVVHWLDPPGTYGVQWVPLLMGKEVISREWLPTDVRPETPTGS